MKKTFKIILIIALIVFILSSIFIIVFINNIMGISSVKFDKNKLIMANNETIVFDNNNLEIENTLNNSSIVKVDELPNYVVSAFVSIEDKDFFKHKGLNYKRIAKAMFNNLKKMSFAEGASTISQQLIKNTHLSNEKTIKRKLKEMLLTKKLEKEFTKKDILETYLNVIYFGENSYGIDRAANTYFNKKASELTISEAATLAGIIKSPYKYSPVYNYENCINRRNLVLSEMLKDKKITETQYNEAINSELIIYENEQKDMINNLYVKACLQEAQEILNLSQKDIRLSNLKIYSYYDEDAQKILFEEANNANNYHVNSYGNISDSLMILIDNESKGVKAYAGKSNYDLTSFNRQPGSTIKPILVYAPAMEKGLISPDTLILDEPINYGGYSPNNVGGNNHGYVSVNYAISQSLNIPAVKTLDYVGIENAKEFAQNAGIKFSNSDNGLAIALGGFTDGTTLKELTNSFLPFINNGKYDTARFIKKIVDSKGQVIYEHKINEKQIMGEDTAYLMTSMLKDACFNGTSAKLKDLPFDVASKTGTVAIKGTNNNTDAYSVAYTTKHTMGVWFGNYSLDAEHILEGKNNGGTYATQVIKNSFEKLYEENKPNNFVKPDSIVEIKIDNKIYENEHVIKLASENCPERYVKTIFVAERFKPKETSLLFDSLSVSNFDANLVDNNIEITFDAEDYLKYEIYKMHNGVKELIATYSNKSEQIKFVDKNLMPETKYGYYIKVSTINGKTSSVSDTINLITNSKNQKFENLISQNNLDNSWLFR